MVLCQQNQQPEGGGRDCCPQPEVVVSDVVPVRWEAERETCPLAVERKRNALPLAKLCKNLAPSPKSSPDFISSFYKQRRVFKTLGEVSLCRSCSG